MISLRQDPKQMIKMMEKLMNLIMATIMMMMKVIKETTMQVRKENSEREACEDDNDVQAVFVEL